MKRSAPDRRTLAAAAILAVAACLGLWGIRHGLPYSYYPDEAHFVKRALSFGSGDLNPHWFHKPAFFMYILFAEYAALFVTGKVAGLWAGATEFGVRFVRDPGLFYLIGRLTTLGFALGTVAVVMRLGERYLRPGAGLLAGLFLALTTGLLASSQYVKEDVPSMFFATLSLYWVVRYAGTGRLRDLLVAAAAGGASAATKAYGMALLPVIAAAVLWKCWRPDAAPRGARAAAARLAAAVALFALAQFALAPFSFLDPLGRESTFGRIASLFTMIARLTGLGQFAPLPDEHLGRHGGILFGLRDYGRVLASDGGMGWLLTAYAAIGVLALLVRRRFTDLLLVGYALLFVAVSVILYPGYAEPRHQTPIYPVLAAAAGFAAAGLAARAGRRQAVAVGLILLTLLVPLRSVAERAQRVSLEDTRSAAKRWIEETVPAGTRLLLDEAGPPILASEQSLKDQIESARRAAGSGQFTTHYDTYVELQMQAARGATAYDVEEIRRPWWRESEPESASAYLTSDYDRDMANPLRRVGVATYDDYVNRGIVYAVVHSEAYGSVMKNPKVAALWPSFTRFYRELFRRGTLVREFNPETGPYTGPVVRIYRLAP
jgi:hypothetical protein